MIDQQIIELDDFHASEAMSARKLNKPKEAYNRIISGVRPPTQVDSAIRQPAKTVTGLWLAIRADSRAAEARTLYGMTLDACMDLSHQTSLGATTIISVGGNAEVVYVLMSAEGNKSFVRLDGQTLAATSEIIPLTDNTIISIDGDAGIVKLVSPSRLFYINLNFKPGDDGYETIFEVFNDAFRVRDIDGVGGNSAVTWLLTSLGIRLLDHDSGEQVGNTTPIDVTDVLIEGQTAPIITLIDIAANAGTVYVAMRLEFPDVIEAETIKNKYYILTYRMIRGKLEKVADLVIPGTSHIVGMGGQP